MTTKRDEITANPPEKLFAYWDNIRADLYRLTTWHGDELGKFYTGRVWRSNMGDRRASFRITIGNAEYSGTAFLDSGTYCRLRRINA